MNIIEEWLNSRIGLNFRSGLGRMEQAVRLLGMPQDAYPIIHVTGTNGKGSTVAFLRQLFAGQGRKVGSFTSPHMVTIHDRICINGQPISDADFVRLGQAVQEMEQQLLETHDQLSYFEILTLIGLLYFREQAVDLALIEVGIGGLLDTTNVVTGQVAVVTSVGLDHQETLGSTLAEIAEQKAGIFKPGKTAVIGPLPSQALEVCQQVAAEKSVHLYQAGQDFTLDGTGSSLTFANGQVTWSNLILGLKGKYQQENASLALQAFWLFCQQEGWSVDARQIAPALAGTYWSGRLEEVAPGIYLDGAHNLPAMKRLVDFIREQKGAVSILFGALKRKDYKEMLAYLQAALPDAQLTITTFACGETVAENDVADLPYVADYKAYIEQFQANRQPDQPLFVTGSLYFIAEVRAWYLEKYKQ